MRSLALLLTTLWAGMALAASPVERDSEAVVPLHPAAQSAAEMLATQLGANLLEGTSAYQACVKTEDGAPRLDAACVARVGQSAGAERLIVVSLREERELTAYSVRISDGAAMRFATAHLDPATDGSLSAAVETVAKTLRGSFGVADIFGVLPLLVLVLGGMLLLLLDAFSRPGARKDFTAYFAAVVGLLSFLLAYGAWSPAGFPYARELFGGLFTVDRFSLFFAMLTSGAVVLTSLLALGFFRGYGIERGEFYALMVLSAAGMVAMAQATDLFVLFISLEIMSLAIYVLVGFMRHDKRGAEGAMKYFLMGAFSSAFLLYGIALVYGVLGTTQLDLIAQALREHGKLLENPILIVGVFLVLGAFLFKISAFPFHMWTPDAYQAAPSPVTGFMSFGVKAAAFAALLRVFGGAFLEFRGSGVSDWLEEGISLGWYAIVFVLAAATMLLGNIVAIAQTNLKRMLAYSSIAHAGYLMVGLAAMAVQIGPEGWQTIPLLDAGRGVLFYLLGYGFTNLVAFGVLGALERRGEDLAEFSSLRGVARRHPALALAMSIAMLSLAGIPPTAGFFGKLVLFREAIRAGNPDLLYLTILGVLASVIGVYYYLRVVVVMYMEDPKAEAVEENVPRPTALYAGIFGAVAIVLYLGFFPNRYVSLADEAIRDLAGQPAPEPAPSLSNVAEP